MPYTAPLPAPVPTEPRFLAVIYAFAVWSGGERRLVTDERIAASTLAMLQPQLDATARRTRVDQGPGLIVFDNYRDAFQAAQSLATVAATVEVREVTPTTEQRGAGWTGADGVRYVALPGGLVRSVKGQGGNLSDEWGSERRWTEAPRPGLGLQSTGIPRLTKPVTRHFPRRGPALCSALVLFSHATGVAPRRSDRRSAARRAS